MTSPSHCRYYVDRPDHHRPPDVAVIGRRGEDCGQRRICCASHPRGGGAGVRPIVVLADEGIPTLNHGPDQTRGQKMAAMPPRQLPNCLVGSNPPPPEEGRPRLSSLRPPPPDRDVEERPPPGDQDASVVGIDHLTPAVRCYRSSAGEDPVATPIVDVPRRLSSEYVRPR